MRVERNNILNLLGGPSVERRPCHLGLSRAGAVHRLALVAESFLSEPFWMPATTRALGPRITMRMKRDACDIHIVEQ